MSGETLWFWIGVTKNILWFQFSDQLYIFSAEPNVFFVLYVLNKFA